MRGPNLALSQRDRDCSFTSGMLSKRTAHLTIEPGIQACDLTTVSSLADAAVDLPTRRPMELELSLRLQPFFQRRICP